MHEDICSSIVIPTIAEHLTKIDELLKSLLAKCNQMRNVEIILVINSSEMKSWIINTRGMNRVRMVHESQPGLHHARHTGAVHAKGEILIFLDDDVIVAEGWLQNILACFSDPSVAIVGGKVEPKWEVTPPSWIYKTSPDYLSLLDYGDKMREIKGKEGLNGCNFAIRRDVLFEVKGFNPDGFPTPEMVWYRGDGEYGLIQKVLEKGYKVVYCPSALVYHCIPSTRLTDAYFEKRAFSEGISRAYSLIRKTDGSISFIYLLILLCFFLAHSTSIYKKLKRGPDLRIKYKLAQVKYTAMKQYGIQLLKDRNLLMYMKKDHYMDSTDE